MSPWNNFVKFDWRVPKGSYIIVFLIGQFEPNQRDPIGVQPRRFSFQRFSYSFVTLMNQSHRISLNAEGQSMPPGQMLTKIKCW